jgi:7-carboxy-7-deazaguanine synthase
VFGQNEVVGLKYFKDTPEDSMFVTSMFYSIQGEGPLRGKPAYFIRLAKCNLSCSFCDAFFDEGEWMTFDEIKLKIMEDIADFFDRAPNSIPDWAKKILHYNADSIPSPSELILVITGGEPMLQQNLNAFLSCMSFMFSTIQIESNGTIYQHLDEGIVLVVSPKCLEKENVPVRYLEPNMRVLNRANCLKFVMSADLTSPYSTIPEWVHEWARETDKSVFVSPINIYNDVTQRAKAVKAQREKTTLDQRSTELEIVSFWEPDLLNMQQNQRNHEYAARYCMRNGFIFGVQLHLFASLA